MREYILAIDQGTTSSRVLVVDKKGNVPYISQKNFPQYFPSSEKVEQEPMEILDSVLFCLHEACEYVKEQQGTIASLGITNQRETVICFNKKTGKPFYRALVWQDHRTSEYCQSLKDKGLEESLREKTGLLLDPYFSGTKIHWLIKELGEQEDMVFGTVDSWLIYNLSGGRSFVTDYSNASRTILFNIHDLCWDKELLKLFEVKEEMLPKVLPSSSDFGEINIDEPLLKGVHIEGVAGDQQAALFGQGCFMPGEAKTTYGTGIFMLMNTADKPVRSDNRLLTTIGWGLDNKVTYALEGSAFHGADTINWIRDGLEITKESAQCSAYAKEAEDNHGVYFVPAFTGMGAPYWDTDAQALITGITRGTDKKDICRAAIESLGYQVRDLTLAMEKDSGIAIEQLRVDGGASKSDVLMQFQADLLDVKVNRPKITESTGLGAAYLAGLHKGFWTSLDELKSIRESSSIFEPSMNEKKRKELIEGWEKAVRKARTI